MTGLENENGAVRGKVLTANILNDGVVVYLADDGGWTEILAEARFLADKAEQAGLLDKAGDDVDRRIIVDPYLMDANLSEDGPVPVSQRERIRAYGPTIPTDFNAPRTES